MTQKYKVRTDPGVYITEVSNLNDNSNVHGSSDITFKSAGLYHIVILAMNDIEITLADRGGALYPSNSVPVFKTIEVIGGGFAIKIDYVALNNAIESIVSAYSGGISDYHEI